MNVAAFADLIAEWHEQADLFARRGLEDEAAMTRSFAAELEQAVDAWRFETLTLGDAAEESGVAYSTLQQRVRKGEIPDAGEKGAPRIRRCDLPTRPNAKRKTARSRGGPDLAAEVLAHELAS